MELIKSSYIKNNSINFHKYPNLAQMKHVIPKIQYSLNADKNKNKNIEYNPPHVQIKNNLTTENYGTE